MFSATTTSWLLNRIIWLKSDLHNEMFWTRYKYLLSPLLKASSFTSCSRGQFSCKRSVLIYLPLPKFTLTLHVNWSQEAVVLPTMGFDCSEGTSLATKSIFLRMKVRKGFQSCNFCLFMLLFMLFARCQVINLVKNTFSPWSRGIETTCLQTVKMGVKDTLSYPICSLAHNMVQFLADYRNHDPRKMSSELICCVKAERFLILLWWKKKSFSSDFIVVLMSLLS